MSGFHYWDCWRKFGTEKDSSMDLEDSTLGLGLQDHRISHGNSTLANFGKENNVSWILFKFQLIF